MLPDWVSYCRVGDYVVFLDVRRNRYLALTRRAAAPLLEGDLAGLSPKVTAQVRALGWVTDRRETDRSETNRCETVWEPPRRELKIAARRAGGLLGPARQFLPSLVKARLRLAFRPLEVSLRLVTARNIAIGTDGGDGSLEDILAAFTRIERSLTANTCLVRALALHAVLARQGYASVLVFGVKMHPFEAHCWLQRGDLVINDTIEQVGLFTPIRAAG